MPSTPHLILQGCIAVSFWLFLATLPPLHIGLWVDSEAALVCTYWLYALTGVGLILTRDIRISRRSQLFGVLSIVSLIATLWAENKTLHHWGAPMLGEGSAMQVGLTLLSLAYDQLDGARLRWIKTSACLAAVVAGLLVLCNNPMHWLGWHPEWAPYTFAAFLAPMALVVGLCTTFYAAIPLLILSYNKTLILTSIGACATWLCLRFKHRRWLMAVVLVLPVVVIVGDFLGYAIWQKQYNGTDIIMNTWWTLRSRALSIMIYAFSWAQEPWRLLVGCGWGSYFEHLQQNVTSLPIDFFHHGLWRPNWDGLDRIDFHVMHQGLENLFSLGLVGVFVYISLLMLPFRQNTVSFKVFLVAVSFAAVTSTWFTLPTIWPYWMLAWVLAGSSTQNWKGKGPVVAICLGTLIVGHAGWNQWQTASLYPVRENAWLRSFTHSDSIPDVEKWQKPYNYHGFHIPYFVFNLMAKKDQIPPEALKEELKRTLAIYNPQTSTLLMDIGMLHVMKYLAPIEPEYGHMWTDVVKAILRKAPKRSDMAETFIQYALQHQHENDAHELIEAMLQVNSHDVCALWYKGLYLNHVKQSREGVGNMKEALLLGVDRWIPTPQDLVSQLKNPPPQ